MLVGEVWSNSYMEESKRILMSMTKRCNRCGMVKLIEAFSLAPTCKDGRRGACKDCIAARSRTWYQDNRDTRLASCRTYQEAHKSERQAYHRRWYEVNKDRRRQTTAAWRKENDARYRKWQRAYRRVARRTYRNNTPVGWARHTWLNLNKRTINGSKVHLANAVDRKYLRREIRLEMTYQEFKRFVVLNWDKVLTIRNEGLRASIDRKSSGGHYSLDNIQIMSLNENSRKSHDPKIDRCPGQMAGAPEDEIISEIV